MPIRTKSCLRVAGSAMVVVVSLRVVKRVFCHHRRFLISILAKDEIQVRGLRTWLARVGVLFNGPFGLLAD